MVWVVIYPQTRTFDTYMVCVKYNKLYRVGVEEGVGSGNLVKKTRVC